LLPQWGGLEVVLFGKASLNLEQARLLDSAGFIVYYMVQGYNIVSF
jgi:hypothetical protein